MRAARGARVPGVLHPDLVREREALRGSNPIKFEPNLPPHEVGRLQRRARARERQQGVGGLGDSTRRFVIQQVILAWKVILAWGFARWLSSGGTPGH